MDQKHIILLLHGIRDAAAWEGNVRNQLLQYAQERKVRISSSEVKIEPLGYGIVDAIRFLIPLPFLRNRPVGEVYEKLKAIRNDNRDALISIVCHSFGTYIVGRIILMQFEVDFNKIVLVGSVLSRKYPWYALSKERVSVVLNEVGTKDIWPLMAKAMTWGYGIAGWLGFQQGGRVIDRYWHRRHSELLNDPHHAYKHWAPYLIDDASLDHLPNFGGDGNEERPFWTHVLSNGILKYILMAVVGLVVMQMLPYTTSRDIVVIVPVNAGIRDKEPKLSDFEETRTSGSRIGLLKLPPNTRARFVRAETERWGIDPLQNLETVLSKGPFLIDVTTLIFAWTMSFGNEQAFLDKVEQIHRDLIVAQHLGTDDKSLAEAENLKKGLVQLFTEEIIPALKEGKLIDQKYLMVNCERAGSLNDPSGYKDAARMSLSKRAVALGFLNPPYKSALGPYFGVAGEVGAASGPKFIPPVPEADRGSLVAVVYENATDKSLGERWGTAFCAAGAEVPNARKSDIFVRFLINDNIPSDNGDGKCIATIQLKEETSLLRALVHALRGRR